MKITVEISEFWLDEEDQGEIEKVLKDNIIRTVTKNIHSSIEKKIDDQIERQVKKTVEEIMYKKITIDVEERMQSLKLKGRKSGDKVNITDYIKEEIEYSSGWNSIRDKVVAIAKNIADDYKKRYDLLFASQIVSKLNENGMLKDDIAKLILPENSNQ